MAPRKKGLFIGKPHSNGGIPSKVKETGQLIEIEGDEYYICKEAFTSGKEYKFTRKTNKQILDSIYSDFSCKLNQAEMSAGDFIVCKVVVIDHSKRDRSGTAKEILNQMQAEKSCKIEKGSAFKKGGGVDVKVYSEEELAARSKKKKQSLKNISQNIDKLKRIVNRDIKSPNEKECLTALVVLVMLETSERVGNGESAENGHYGVTGLKKKHVKISGDSVKLSYTGKSGVDQDKTISNSRLASELKKAIKNSPSDKVFVTPDGFEIKNDRVNRYLSDLNVSAKDIRGYSANKWIVSKLKRLTPEDTDQKRKKQFNDIVKVVAERVGHGAATLKKHYLLPELQHNWIEKGKVIDLKNFKIKTGSEMEFGGGVSKKEKSEKVGKVMGEFKDKKLKTSHGKKVTDRKQAIAIALSEADRLKKESGGLAQSGWFEGNLSFLNW